MDEAGPVFHWLCNQTVALLTKGMFEGKRRHLSTNQTVNNCCLLDSVAELNIWGPNNNNKLKNTNDCSLHMCVITCLYIASIEALTWSS